MEASIALKKVGKIVGDTTILAGLTFGIEKGSLVAIVGDNDAGKSTLLRVLAGLDNPEFGSVFIHGLDSRRRRRETRMMIGYVPHEIDLDPWLTLDQNIRFSGLLFGEEDKIISRRISRYASELDLGQHIFQPAGQVSPGIQKKAMLLRALVHDPTVLILDEPTAFMDTQSRRLTWGLLKKLRHSKTVLYVSQSLEEVEGAHDRIIMLQDGKVLMDGSLDRLLESSFEYHQFQIEFENLTETLFHDISALPNVVNPSRTGNILHFYGRSRQVFFKVLTQAAENLMIDLNIRKLGLRDLMDAQFAREGLE